MTVDMRSQRPGLPELSVGLAVLAVVAVGGAVGVMQLDLNPVTRGLILTALSGVGGMIAFFAAFQLRLRSWTAFGVRATTWRWTLIAVGLGVATFVLKSLAIMAYVSLTGDSQNIQQVYAAGAGGDIGSAVAAIFFLSVITPLGEEFLFRGVVTNALLRYGPVIGIVGGAFIFAIFHGINAVFPAALVTGLAAGEIFRRSGSIWPAVIVHVIVNLPTIPAMLLAGVKP